MIGFWSDPNTLRGASVGALVVGAITLWRVLTLPDKMKFKLRYRSANNPDLIQITDTLPIRKGRMVVRVPNTDEEGRLRWTDDLTPEYRTVWLQVGRSDFTSYPPIIDLSSPGRDVFELLRQENWQPDKLTTPKSESITA